MGPEDAMDWNAAIERNREALKRVLAMLVAMAELAGVRPTLPRHLHRAVLRLLRPAEAAARRLVIIVARGMVVAVAPGRPRLPGHTATFAPSPSALRADTLPGRATGLARPSDPPDGGEDGRHASRLSVPLFDPLRRFRRVRPARNGVPRISFPGFGDPFPIPLPPSADDPVDAARLALRFAALAKVLDDLPREALRFARWKARRDAGRVRRVWPLRPGRPPGHRPANRGSRHEVHDILDVAQGLAFWALEDTS
jgi:hypothetical protein